MKDLKYNNIFLNLTSAKNKEIFTALIKRKNFYLERIVSKGQNTPINQWLVSKDNEWVMLLAGGARLRFYGGLKIRFMKPGDYVFIPAGKRHRVEWTDPDCKTIWLALHFL